MIRIKLVDDTLGAHQDGRVLYFKLADLQCFIVEGEYKPVSGKVYPKCAWIHLKGNEVKFRVLLDDLNKSLVGTTYET
jgi:hypothetical protein